MPCECSRRGRPGRARRGAPLRRPELRPRAGAASSSLRRRSGWCGGRDDAGHRHGGTVAACVWDFTGGMTMLRAYWDSAREVNPNAPDEIQRFGGPARTARGFVARGRASRHHRLFARGFVSLPRFRRALAIVTRGAPRDRLEPTSHRWTRRAARRCAGCFASASVPREARSS